VSEGGLRAAVDLMRADGATPTAIATFANYYRIVEAGGSGFIAEADIEPITTLPTIDDIEVSDDVAAAAIAATVTIRLNGGLATSMGLDRAKSLLEVKPAVSFLDVIATQTLALRRRYGVRLPVLFMDSFRTSADTLAALAGSGLATPGLALDFLQSRIPKLWVDDLAPVDWPADPSLAWCPPGHADLYQVLYSSGLLDQLIGDDYRYLFCANSDNLGAVPDARIAGWLAANDIPLALESTRRTPSDRKGGHLARRKSDGRIVLRETAQTAPEDQIALQQIDRHPFCNTNNLWLDLVALRDLMRRTDGVIELPLIRNVKPVDPQEPSSPKVVQLETAMGAAIALFDRAQSVLVGRDRFLPVKTTNDLLVMRSDSYDLSEDGRLSPAAGRAIEADPFVDLDPDYYRILHDFDARFPFGPPSLVDCVSLTVRGDVTFGANVTVRGRVELSVSADGPRVADGAQLGSPATS
jgi:UTP--glucose-1-phosphate uridylyltransferase